MIPFAVGLLVLHVALAADSPAEKADDGYHAGRHHGHRGHGGAHYYRGRYAGKCGYDGFYYRDSHSFVICSNGNAYVQPCAPGTKNSGHKSYQYGKAYSAVPFCDVNLVDYGYNLKHGYGHRGYGKRAGYGHGYGHGRRGYGGGYGHGRRHGHGGYGYNRGYGYGGYHDDDYYHGGRRGGYGRHGNYLY